MSVAERAFMGVLRDAVGDLYAIAPQMSLGALLYVPARVERATSWRNRIDRKTVDFVLLEPQRLRPVAVVELDDASHAQDRRTERDRWVDEVCRAAELPIVHIKARKSYHVRELRATILKVIGEPVDKTS